MTTLDVNALLATLTALVVSPTAPGYRVPITLLIVSGLALGAPCGR